MSTAAWLGIGAAVILVLYVLIMRLFMRESRELEKHIDYRKIQPWQERD
ncbi:MAG: hypothetical protein ACYDCF_01320 [Burkholderiales bacterium]|nr:hypothetical protein [Ferrovum sp.]